ncbi:MAG: alpha/beta fold hydrolase [Solirubrobacteraceae bacterium]|nr:alpha/beta fold hydrolase [Solirubrobacteraceae bacterium]
MNHHREGSGPPLVLIHGIGHHWQGWQAVIPALAKDFDVIACDSPGFGASAPLRHAGPPTIPVYVDAFERFFADQGLDRPHVAGNSMGGAIALELARRGVVRSATAFSPAGFWNTAELKWCQASLGLIQAIPEPLRPVMRALTANPHARGPLFATLYRWPAKLAAEDAVATLQAAWDAPAFRAGLSAFDQYRFAPQREPMPVPTTVAWGDHDRLLPFRLQAPRARKALPDAVHVTLGAGHLPMTDDPPAVTATIRATARRAEG